MNIQIECQKIGISITTAEFMLDRAISKEHKNNIQKAIEGKNLKVKEANELLQKIFSAIIINGDDGDAIINKELENNFFLYPSRFFCLSASRGHTKQKN